MGPYSPLVLCVRMTGARNVQLSFNPIINILILLLHLTSGN